MNFKDISKILLLVVLVVATVFILYFVFFGLGSTSLKTNNDNELNLDTITINIQGEDFSYIKADLSLEGDDKGSIKNMEKNKKYIRRMMIELLAKQNGRELMKDVNKMKLKNEIKKEIEETVGVHVKNVYFRNFVLAP